MRENTSQPRIAFTCPISAHLNSHAVLNQGISWIGGITSGELFELPARNETSSRATPEPAGGLWPMMKVLTAVRLTGAGNRPPIFRGMERGIFHGIQKKNAAIHPQTIQPRAMHPALVSRLLALYRSVRIVHRRGGANGGSSCRAAAGIQSGPDSSFAFRHQASRASAAKDRCEERDIRRERKERNPRGEAERSGAAIASRHAQ